MCKKSFFTGFSSMPQLFLDLTSIFSYVLGEYDRISPALVKGDLASELLRAHKPFAQKAPITFSMLQKNDTGIGLSEQERRSLVTSIKLARDFMLCHKSPSAELLEKGIRDLVGRRNSSSGETQEALTLYLSVRALHFIGFQAGEGAGAADISPLELALGLE